MQVGSDSRFSSVLLEEEIWRLQEENEKKEKAIAELQKKEERRRSLEEEVKQLKEEQELLEQKVLMLSGRSHALISRPTTVTPRRPSPSPPDLPTDLDACQNCDSVLASLEAEQRESARLQKENKALVNGIFQLQTEVRPLHRRRRRRLSSFHSLLVSCSALR